MSKDESIIPFQESTTLPTIDEYDDVESNLSPAARERLLKTILSSKAGLVTMAPLICKGPTQCPFIERCPIYQVDGLQGTYPLKRQCIVELNIVQNKFSEYMEELKNNGEKDPYKSPTMRAQVSKLAELDLYDYRIDLILAGVTAGTESDGTLLVHQEVPIPGEGNDPVEQIDEHPAWKIKDRIQRQRMELLDAMGLTVKRKAMIDASLGRSSTESYLGRAVEILEKLAFKE